MKETLEALKKATGALGAATRVLGKVERIRRSDRPSFFEMQETCREALEALRKVPEIDATVREARKHLEEVLDQASRHLERERALLAGRIATALQEAGFPVRGQLPLLSVSAFTLEFVQGRRALCAIWLGPRQEKIRECPLDPEAIVLAVKTADEDLFGSPLDEEAVLREIHEAYRMACLRRHLPEGERVPLTAVLLEMAVQRQSPSFLADPVKERYRPFGRIHFACLLGRLRRRRIGDLEMRLDTATMAQTRRALDHLWIPRGRTGDGTRCATMTFGRAREEATP